jgi:hypothetical protein
MAEPIIMDWNPSFGVDPRTLQLSQTIDQLHQIKSTSKVFSQGLHHNLQHVPGLDALNAEALPVALAGLDLDMQDQGMSSSGYAHGIPGPLYDVEFPEIGGSAGMYEICLE